MPQIRVVERLTCSGCDNTWTGVTRAHCPACHRTYNSAGLFTAHRRDVRGVGTCHAPAADMRLIDGIWRGPAVEHEWYEAS